jgi:hypothetical protein
MSIKRGREGRLKPQHAALYPGLQAGEWLPVEVLIRHVTNLIHTDPSRSRKITGLRLLHQDHFEYRGASERPEGLPTGATRLSDAGAEPGAAGQVPAGPGHEPPTSRGPDQ